MTLYQRFEEGLNTWATDKRTTKFLIGFNLITCIVCVVFDILRGEVVWLCDANTFANCFYFIGEYFLLYQRLLITSKMNRGFYKKFVVCLIVPYTICVVMYMFLESKLEDGICLTSVSTVLQIAAGIIFLGNITTWIFAVKTYLGLLKGTRKQYRILFYMNLSALSTILASTTALVFLPQKDAAYKAGNQEETRSFDELIFIVLGTDKIISLLLSLAILSSFYRHGARNSLNTRKSNKKGVSLRASKNPTITPATADASSTTNSNAIVV